MGKISKVLYREIDPSVCSKEKAAEFYVHFNLMGMGEPYAKAFEDYEAEQIRIRNDEICKAGLEAGYRPDVHTSVFGVSSIRNRAVVLAEC